MNTDKFTYWNMFVLIFCIFLSIWSLRWLIVAMIKGDGDNIGGNLFFFALTFSGVIYLGLELHEAIQ